MPRHGRHPHPISEAFPATLYLSVVALFGPFQQVLFAFSFCLIGFERAGWYPAARKHPPAAPHAHPSTFKVACTRRHGSHVPLTACRYVHETDDGEQLVGHPITRPDGAFWAPFWVVYGDVNPDAYRSMLESGTGWLIWSYSMVASVILVNLLVAMMADTYARVQAHAEGMYIYQKYIRTFAHRHLHTVVPPPFNLPWTLFDVITVKSGCRKPWRLPVPTQRGFADGSALLQAYKEAMRTSAAVEMGQLLGRLERALWDQREESAELLERKLSKLEKAMRDEMHEQSCQVTDEIRELVQGSSKRRHHSHRT